MELYKIILMIILKYKLIFFLKQGMIKENVKVLLWNEYIYHKLENILINSFLYYIFREK